MQHADRTLEGIGVLFVRVEGLLGPGSSYVQTNYVIERHEPEEGRTQRGATLIRDHPQSPLMKPEPGACEITY